MTDSKEKKKKIILNHVKSGPIGLGRPARNVCMKTEFSSPENPFLPIYNESTLFQYGRYEVT